MAVEMMPKWQNRTPKEFEKTCHQRNIEELVFSSFKCRFITAIRIEPVDSKIAAAHQVRLLPLLS